MTEHNKEGDAMRMRVVNQQRWLRTKIATAVVLFLVALGCAGGLESRDPAAPIPNVTGFVTAIVLLAWLSINIVKTGG